MRSDEKVFRAVVIRHVVLMANAGFQIRYVQTEERLGDESMNEKSFSSDFNEQISLSVSI